QAQQTQWKWQDTGLPWPPHEGLLCMDWQHPHTFFVNEADGTVAYDWVTKHRTVVNRRSFMVCGPRGLLFAGTGSDQGAWRYSLDDPVGRAIDHMPMQVAHDGSLAVYSYPQGNAKLVSGRFPFWFSADGGLTW